MSKKSVIQSVILNVLSALKTSNEDYCDIETIDSGSNIVFSNGAMMSLIKYDGLMSIITAPEFYSMIEFMSRELNSFLQKSGYKIAVVFRKDLDSYPLVERSEKIQKTTAKKLKLDVDDLIDENVKIYQNGVYNEEVWFAVITMPCVLDKVEAETVAEERMAVLGPALKNAQNILAPMDVLRAKHSSFVGKVAGALSNKRFYTKSEVVNVLEALNFIKRQIVPEYASKNWRPSVAIGTDVAQYIGFNNYQTPVTWPITNNRDDLSHLFPPTLSRQLMGGHAISVLGPREGLPSHTVALGGRLYSSIMMDIAPNQPSIFDSLFAAFNQNTSKDLKGRTVAMPWSVSFMLTGDGMAGMSIKNALSQIFAKVPPHTNNSLTRALTQLKHMEREKVAIVGFQLSAMTWVEDTPEARKTLRERKIYLQSTLETWGGMTTKDNVGDPIMLWRSNILGLSDKHIGTVAAVALPDALALLPLTRPASPFNNGTILHKTLDGKIMFLEKFSAQQTTWVTVITGVPGSGKSVMLNNLLFETALMPGLQRLPWISIIDKGISSTGLTDLIRDRLPPERRHLVASKRLRKDKAHAINPFDIKVGLTFPLESERTQIVTFLTTLMTPAELEKPYEDTTSFCSELVKLAFEEIQDTGANARPNMYKPHYNKELDGLLQEYKVLNYARYDERDEYGRWVERIDFEKYDEASYFSLVRKLHQMGERAANTKDRDRLWRARDLAHRYAMPTLHNLIPIIESPKIKEAYRNKVASTETMPEFALRRLHSIIAEYECFSNFTEFDVDTARILSLDLQDVIDDRNRQQTALFFQAARMVSIKKFSLSEDDVKPEKIPAIFMPYYRNLLKELNSDRKTLAFDELHNAKSDLTTMKQLEKDAREGRKWGLELILASQQLVDFSYEGDTKKESVDLIGFATTICVCSPPSDANLTLFKESISSNQGVLDEFNKIGISPHGLTYFAQFRTKQNKYSTYITNQVGNKKLWSLTTDQVDRSVRSAVFNRVPNMKKAIEILAWGFGGGAASKVKERSSMIGENISDQQQANLIEQMAIDLITAYEAQHKA